MKQFHSPIDPVFWRWHHWVDNIRAAWLGIRPLRLRREFAEVVRILFGVTGDGGGVVIQPNGDIKPIPPSDPVGSGLRGLSPAVRDVLMGHLIGKVGDLLEITDATHVVRKLAAELTGNAVKRTQ